jgi:hypothetical protein
VWFRIHDSGTRQRAANSAESISSGPLFPPVRDIFGTSAVSGVIVSITYHRVAVTLTANQNLSFDGFSIRCVTPQSLPLTGEPRTERPPLGCGLELSSTLDPGSGRSSVVKNQTLISSSEIGGDRGLKRRPLSPHPHPWLTIFLPFIPSNSPLSLHLNHAVLDCVTG